MKTKLLLFLVLMVSILAPATAMITTADVMAAQHFNSDLVDEHNTSLDLTLGGGSAVYNTNDYVTGTASWQSSTGGTTGASFSVAVQQPRTYVVWVNVTNVTDQYQGIFWGQPSSVHTMQFEGTNVVFRTQNSVGTNKDCTVDISTYVTLGWNMLWYDWDNSNDNANCGVGSAIQNNISIDNPQGLVTTFDHLDGNLDTVFSHLDSWFVFNRILTDQERQDLYNSGSGLAYPFDIDSSPPILSSYNCTSCNVPFGDNTTPYTTSDTTPTFTLATDINANCRIADEDWNYTTMSASRDCTTTGNMNHTCSLTVQDELVFATDHVYVSCENANMGNESFASSSGALEMDITNLATTITNAIDTGIQSSSIWPGATIYNDQQVYLRDLNNNQLLATADRVATYGNQRWIINYDNTTKLGLFNITPVVYVLDMVNISSSEIQTQVSALINSTKT